MYPEKEQQPPLFDLDPTRSKPRTPYERLKLTRSSAQTEKTSPTSAEAEINELLSAWRDENGFYDNRAFRPELTLDQMGDPKHREFSDGSPRLTMLSEIYRANKLIARLRELGVGDEEIRGAWLSSMPLRYDWWARHLWEELNTSYKRSVEDALKRPKVSLDDEEWGQRWVAHAADYYRWYVSYEELLNDEPKPMPEWLAPLVQGAENDLEIRDLGNRIKTAKEWLASHKDHPRYEEALRRYKDLEKQLVTRKVKSQDDTP